MAPVPRRPVEILKDLLRAGVWYSSAVELDNHGPNAVDGEELHKEAVVSVAQAESLPEGVALMPVPRCDQCAHWGSEYGESSQPCAEMNRLTRRDFGCVWFQAK